MIVGNLRIVGLTLLLRENKLLHAAASFHRSLIGELDKDYETRLSAVFEASDVVESGARRHGRGPIEHIWSTRK